MISCLPSARGKAEVDVRAVTPERGRLGERLIVVEFGEHHILDEVFVVKDDDPSATFQQYSRSWVTVSKVRSSARSWLT